MRRKFAGIYPVLLLCFLAFKAIPVMVLSQPRLLGMGSADSGDGLAGIASQLQASSTVGSVIINEVAWSGTAASPRDEWIELYNTTDQPIDLTSWTLEAADGTPSIILSGTIPPKGFFLLERTDDNTISDIPADQVYGNDGPSWALKNTGETLFLKDPAGSVIDTANGDGGPWPAGTASTGSPPYASMERIDPLAPDSDANWATNDGVHRNGLDANGDPINGTPKAKNSTLNQPPSCSDIAVNVNQDTVADITPACSDPEGDPLSYEIVSQPAHGSASVVSGKLRYTPQAGYTGLDSFTYRANDGAFSSNTATVNITVQPPNSPPVADAGADQTVSVGDPVQLDGTSSYDPDSDPLSFQWRFVSKPTGSQAQLSGSTSPTPTFTPDVEGDYVVELTVGDGRGGTDSDQVTVVAIGRDLNRDGKVNTIDARICLRAALRLIPLSTDDQRRCDVDNDGTVEEEDARKIAQYSLGLISKLAQAGGLAAAASGLLVLGLALVGGLPIWIRRLRTAKVLALAALILASSTLLSGCLGLPAGLFLPHQPSRLIADVGSTSIVIHVQNMPNGGLAALEARAGGFIFDPAVIEVRAIQPGAGWQLLASKIDNVKGEVRFAVVNPVGGTVTGRVLVLTIQRKQSGDAGLRWDKAKLTLGDANDREITSYQTKP